MAQRYESYKDSETQWLGKIPSHWGCVRLKNLGTCQNGVSKGGDYFGEGFPFVSYSDAYKNIVLPTKVQGLAKSTEDDRIAYSVEKGDVLFTRTSESIDEIGFASTCLETIKDSVFAGFLIRFRPNTCSIIPEYYKYYFRSMHLRKFFTKEMNIVTRASLSQQLLGQLKVLIPSIEEQRCISMYLDRKCDKLDEWLDKKQKEVEHLKELRQRVIADAVTQGLNPNVTMKPTNIPWLPEVPEHWVMIRNKSMLQLTDEKVGDRKDITLLSLTKQGVIIRDLSEGKGKFPKDFNTYLVVNPNNLVFCLFDVDETPRTVGLVRNYGMLTGAYTNFEVNEGIVIPEYIYNYYLQIDDMKGLRPYYTGLRKVVKTSTFLQLKMPVPPLEEQKQIVAYINDKTSKIDKLIVNINKEIEDIKEYKQRLISDVVTGQIKVC
ncbi:restriction endonuclease subunit S [Bacteroides xylanisolvens]|uniref:restriction endonuclease subunit S n=1 Tax=Bacteroides xylanisolvens TaxID=371601 RepID=UPI0022EB1DC9|nr:restriction endonuclease subunit S [Bacteroides xylanisolvens]